MIFNPWERKVNYPKIFKKPGRILLTTVALSLLTSTACQAGSSSTTGSNVTQTPIAPTAMASPPATQPMPTISVVLTEEITGTEAPVVETQVAQPAAISGQLSGRLTFIRDDNLWVHQNGVEKQLTTDAIPTEIPYWTGLPKLWYSNPQLSLDGTKLAYLKNTNTRARTLIVFDSESQSAHQIVDDVEWAMPIIQWSNDSQKIYYLSPQSGETKIVRSVNLTTGEKQDHGQFTLTSECGGGSPDVADHLSAGENITGIGSGVQIFELSPQNNYIVHTTACTGSGLGILDLPTQQERELDREARGAAISPDGLRIAAISGDEIVIYEASSGKIQKSFPTPEEPLVLLWQAEGKTVLYSTSTLVKELEFETEVAFEYIGSAPAGYRANRSTLWAMSIDTGESERITDFDAHSLKPIFATSEKVLVVVVENAYTLFDYISQQRPKENMVAYYPKVNIAEVDLASLRSNIVASRTQEASYSIK